MAKKATRKKWALDEVDFHQRTVHIKRGDETHLTLSRHRGEEIAVSQPLDFGSPGDIYPHSRPHRGVVPVDQLQEAVQRLACFDNKENDCE